MGGATAVYRGKTRHIRFGVAGMSDILAVAPPNGRLICVECKKPGGKLRPNQAAFLDNMRAAGAVALVVSDVRQLEIALKAEGVVPP